MALDAKEILKRANIHLRNIEVRRGMRHGMEEILSPEVLAVLLAMVEAVNEKLKEQEQINKNTKDSLDAMIEFTAKHSAWDHGPRIKRKKAGG